MKPEFNDKCSWKCLDPFTALDVLIAWALREDGTHPRARRVVRVMLSALTVLLVAILAAMAALSISVDLRAFRAINSPPVTSQITGGTTQNTTEGGYHESESNEILAH